MGDAPEYTNEDQEQETLVYALGIISWLVIIYLLGLIREDIFLLLILSIPVVVFGSFMVNKACYYPANLVTSSTEFLYIIITIFLAWILVSSSKEKTETTNILFISLGLYIFSLIDFKICTAVIYDASIIIFETMAVTLILSVVYLYLRENYKSGIVPVVPSFFTP